MATQETSKKILSVTPSMVDNLQPLNPVQPTIDLIKKDLEDMKGFINQELIN